MNTRTVYDPHRVNLAVAACLVVIALGVGSARLRDALRNGGAHASPHTASVR